jgi:hypothetical protein
LIDKSLTVFVDDEVITQLLEFFHVVQKNALVAESQLQGLRPSTSK